jgi:citrate synthase
MSSISILITRNSNSTSDDHIRIVPDADNTKMFHVTYLDVEGDTDNKRTKYTFTTTATGVQEYLDTTMNLLLKDDEPFKQLQFNLPAYPRIMVNLEKLQDDEFMETLWRAIASVCDDWPQRVHDKPVESREPTASQRYFNSY